MDTIKLIIGGHEYDARVSDSWGPTYLCNAINYVLHDKLKWPRLKWNPSVRENGKWVHKNINYNVFDDNGKEIQPMTIHLRDVESRPELHRVTINKPIGSGA